MIDAALSALANLVLLFAIPFTVYAVYQARRHRRPIAELGPRLGLVVGDLRYTGYCAIAAVIIVAFIVLRPPPVEPFTREGSAQHAFVGLGITVPSILKITLSKLGPKHVKPAVYVRSAVPWRPLT